jgi:hypothetical protein
MAVVGDPDGGHFSWLDDPARVPRSERDARRSEREMAVLSI